MKIIGSEFILCNYSRNANSRKYLDIAQIVPFRMDLLSALPAKIAAVWMVLPDPGCVVSNYTLIPRFTSRMLN